jgi:hypothetical protein
MLALLCFAGAAQAQFEPDADTAALYHFDTQTAEGTTPDSGPNGLDGTLEGAVLPTHVEATVGGYGFAYKFDGVDRGANNSRIGMGTDSRVGLRGNGDWTLDVLVTVTSTPADDAYFKGILCRASAGGIDYSLSYNSWTHPQGAETEFWVTTGPASGEAPDYAYAAMAFEGLMEVGRSYAIRVTVSAGAMTMTVNGFEGTSTYWPTQPGAVSPTAPPIAADLTVGDSCLEDYVIRPSELQVDEFRISNVARTDPPPLPPLPLGLDELIPLDLGLGTDPAAFQAYRLQRSTPANQPTVPTSPPPGQRVLR